MKFAKWANSWYRSPKTYQERRTNGKRSKWARAKRNSANLPTKWDDIHVHHDKCWKSTRKTQYRGRNQQNKHTIFIQENMPPGYFLISYFDKAWNLERYFKKHKIPYKMDEVITYEWKWYQYYNKYRKVKTIIGYNFTWWSDKDIGIEYIIC